MRLSGYKVLLQPLFPAAGRVIFLFLIGALSVACASAEMSHPVSPLPLETKIPSPTTITPPSSVPQIPENRLLSLEWPATIRAGDSDLILLTLEVDQEGKLTPTASIQGHQVEGEKIAIPNLYDTHHVIAEGRLDISGLEILPNPQINEPLHPGQTLKFAWSVRPVQVGQYRGMVWLHLGFIPKQGGDTSRLPVSAQKIEIRAVNLLGLSGNAARWMGALGTILGSWLSLDQLISWLTKLWQKRRKKQSSQTQDQTNL